MTRQVALVKECLQEVRALASSKGKMLPSLECLLSGIRASKRLAPFVKRWAQRAARKAAGGEFMGSARTRTTSNWLDGQRGGRCASSSAAAVGDAQALAAEEAKVGAQCEKRMAPLSLPSLQGSPSGERDSDACRRFLPWNGKKM